MVLRVIGCELYRFVCQSVESAWAAEYNSRLPFDIAASYSVPIDGWSGLHHSNRRTRGSLQGLGGRSKGVWA